MEQLKIGKFIAICRKNKNLTQAELAEKLNITDRAISKWETGNGMPDSSIMLTLCEKLGISVNELLSGEKIEVIDYREKAEENLVNLKKQEEKYNKKILLLENVIGVITFISYIFLLYASIISNNFNNTIIFTIGAIILTIIGATVGLKIEQTTGYYECKNCKHRYVPEFKSVFFSNHFGRTRYLKCPKCNKKSWNKKVLSKDLEV